LQVAGAYYGGHPHSLLDYFFDSEYVIAKYYFHSSAALATSTVSHGQLRRGGGTIAALELDSWSRQNSKPPVEITAGIIRGAGDVCAPMFERFEAS